MANVSGRGLWLKAYVAGPRMHSTMSDAINLAKHLHISINAAHGTLDLLRRWMTDRLPGISDENIAAGGDLSAVSDEMLAEACQLHALNQGGRHQITPKELRQALHDSGILDSRDVLVSWAQDSESLYDIGRENESARIRVKRAFNRAPAAAFLVNAGIGSQKECATLALKFEKKLTQQNSQLYQREPIQALLDEARAYVEDSSSLRVSPRKFAVSDRKLSAASADIQRPAVDGLEKAPPRDPNGLACKLAWDTDLRDIGPHDQHDHQPKSEGAELTPNLRVSSGSSSSSSKTSLSADASNAAGPPGNGNGEREIFLEQQGNSAAPAAKPEGNSVPPGRGGGLSSDGGAGLEQFQRDMDTPERIWFAVEAEENPVASAMHYVATPEHRGKLASLFIVCGRNEVLLADAFRWYQTNPKADRKSLSAFFSRSASWPSQSVAAAKKKRNVAERRTREQIETRNRQQAERFAALERTKYRDWLAAAGKQDDKAGQRAWFNEFHSIAPKLTVGESIGQVLQGGAR